MPKLLRGGKSKVESKSERKFKTKKTERASTDVAYSDIPVLFAFAALHTSTYCFLFFEARISTIKQFQSTKNSHESNLEYPSLIFTRAPFFQPDAWCGHRECSPWLGEGGGLREGPPTERRTGLGPAPRQSSRAHLSLYWAKNKESSRCTNI